LDERVEVHHRVLILDDGVEQLDQIEENALL